MDQSYLLKDKYDATYIKNVYDLPKISLDDFLKIAGSGTALRIEYSSMPEYTSIAKTLKLMADTKV
jgi:alpha-1,3-mannosyl-glycoprotein beta-1,2-N-acetylglucosaminyltransferase